MITKYLSSGGYYHDEVIFSELKEDEDSINTPCSFNTTCTNNTICTITLMAKGYDPDLDWGEFSVEVSQDSTSTRQSVVVEGDQPRLLVMIAPTTAAVNKVRNG